MGSTARSAETLGRRRRDEPRARQARLTDIALMTGPDYRIPNHNWNKYLDYL